MMLDKTRREGINIESIRSQYEAIDGIKFIKERRKEWGNHLQRVYKNRLIRIARNLKPHVKRDPRRPSKRWRENWISTENETEVHKRLEHKEKQAQPTLEKRKKTKLSVFFRVYFKISGRNSLLQFMVDNAVHSQ